MHAAAGELPDQPRVDRPAEQLAAGRTRLRAPDPIEDPAHLRRGEVGVDHETGALAHQRFEPARSQLFADARARAALPYDRGMDRATGRAFPHDGGLALVGDADGRDVRCADARRRDRLAPDGDRRREDLVGIVLDVSRRRVALRDLAIRAATDRAGRVEDEGGRAGRALVEREDEGHVALKRRMGSTSRQYAATSRVRRSSSQSSRRPISAATASMQSRP